MSEEKKLVPELRFPKFKESEDWLLTTIGEVGRFYYGKSAPKWSLSSDGPNLCVRYGELYTKFDTIISEVTSRTNIDPSDLRFSKGGEILVPRVGEVALDFAEHVCYLPFSNIAIGEMISVYETPEYPIFYAYYFRTLRKQFAEVVEGQNVKNLYYYNLEPISIGKPSYLEQQKIASCLSSLDELIAAHGDKLEVLKDHKNGLMQNLFPPEGETAPAYRFAEFENKEAWRRVLIGDITQVTSGGTPDSTNADYWKGDIPWMNSGELNNKRIYSVSNFITRDGLKNSSTKLIPPECVLVGLAGQGKTRGTAAINYFQLCTNQSIAAILPNKKVFISEFLYQLIDSMYEKLRALSAGDGGRGGLNLTIINSIELLLPNLEEQQKIASCLYALDEMINAQTEKVAQLKLHKKGLMQRLFPQIDA